jgi:large subunit ribosomal protein L25
MKTSFELGAEFRDDQGKGASRRLRRSGKVPAILYGGHRDPKGLALDHQKLLTLLDNERFYSTILSVKVGDQSQAVILKDVQRHPARHAVVHVDLQRVVENEKIRIRIPIHFKGESIAIGVKTQGGIVSHQKTDLDVVCLPKDLPEFIEIDVSGLALNQSLHLSDLKVPEGVQLWELAHGRDSTVVSVHLPRAEEEPEPTAVVAVEGVEGAVPAEGAAPAAGAPGAPGAAPAGDAAKKGAPGADAAKKGAAGAEPAKGAEARKDEGKKESPKKEGGKK